MEIINKNKAIERNSNVEVLRLLAMAGVIVLHYNNRQIGQGLNYVEIGSVNEFVLHLLESVSVCSVDLFVMISGFFLSKTNKRSFGKCAVLILQVIIINIIIYFTEIFTNRIEFNFLSFGYQALPLNWFVTLYCTLYLMSPLINTAFHNQYRSKGIVIGLVCVFSVWPTVVDVLRSFTGRDFTGFSTIGMFGSDSGYTIINFLLCYIIGAYIRGKIEMEEKKAGLSRVIYLCITALMITLWSYYDESTAWEYCNPFVIIEAALLFNIFLSFDLGRNKAINRISNCSFTVYLLHIFILSFLNVKLYVTKTAGQMCIHIMICVLLIIAISFIVDSVYKTVFLFLNKKIKRFGEYIIE